MTPGSGRIPRGCVEVDTQTREAYDEGLQMSVVGYCWTVHNIAVTFSGQATFLDMSECKMRAKARQSRYRGHGVAKKGIQLATKKKQ